MINRIKDTTSSIRDGYGEGILECVAAYQNAVVLTADLAESTRVAEVAKRFPKQFVECGVSEQNMMGIAAGLSLEGKVPFVNSFAVFNPGRNWDQLRVSVCYPKLNVKIVGHHAGFSAAFDGATHQAFEDIAITRVLPNLIVLSPCDYHEAKQCVTAAYAYKGPVYIRIGKYTVAPITGKDALFALGKAEVLRPGKDMTLIVTGALARNCVDAAQILHKEIDIEVVKLSTIVPIDTNTILVSAQKTKLVVTVEDHQINGGMGSAVAEVIAEKAAARVVRLGVSGVFGESGSEMELLTHYGLDTASLVTKLRTIYSL